MSKLFVIISKEYLEVVQKKSFFLTLFLIPLLVGGAMVLPTLLIESTESPTQNISIVDLDGRGIGKAIADSLMTLKLSDGQPQFTIEEAAVALYSKDLAWNELRKKLEERVDEGSLDAAFILYPGLTEDDSIEIISKKFELRATAAARRTITAVLTDRRLSAANIGVPKDSLRRLTRRANLTTVSPTGQKRDMKLAFLGSLMFAMIVVILVINYGQSIMRSIIEEKNSRIIEVMISSVTPFQLMLGKILGLGGAAMTQMALWGAMGAGARIMLGARVPAEALESLNALSNPIFLIFGVLFVMSAFFLYSVLFCGIGAMVNSEKDAQNLMMPLTLMLMLSMMMAPAVAASSGAGWVTVVSSIPFLSPSIMISRLSIAPPESFTLSDPLILQSCLSLVGVVITTLLMTWLVARIFRVGILMYGKRATLPEIMRWVRQT